MFLSAISGCIEDDGSDLVDWLEPTRLSVQEFSFHEARQEFELMIRLWDRNDEVTEWKGEFRIILFDANLEVAYDQTTKVEPKDFETETIDGMWGPIIDTRYETKVRASEVRGDPNLHEYPSYVWDVEVWFTYKGMTLVSPRFNWMEPDTGYVSDGRWSDYNDEVSVKVTLTWSSYNITTKAGGLVEVEIIDSLGELLYSRSHLVDAGDFEYASSPTLWGSAAGTLETYVWISIPDHWINKTRDRSGNYAYPTTVDLSGTFVYKGERLDVGDIPSVAIEIPDSHVLPNELPIVFFSGPSSCWQYEEVVFDTTGTHDPDGHIHDMGIIVDKPPPTYWGYDRPSEEDPLSMMKFFDPGYYNVTFKVQDSDLAWAEKTILLEVKKNIKVVALRTGPVTSGYRYNETFITLRVTNQAPLECLTDEPGYPLLIAVDEEGNQFEPSVDNYPTTLGPNEVVELTFTYRYIPPGGTEPVPFVPVTLVMDENFSLDLSGLWVGD